MFSIVANCKMCVALNMAALCIGEGTTDYCEKGHLTKATQTVTTPTPPSSSLQPIWTQVRENSCSADHAAWPISVSSCEHGERN